MTIQQTMHQKRINIVDAILTTTLLATADQNMMIQLIAHQRRINMDLSMVDLMVIPTNIMIHVDLLDVEVRDQLRIHHLNHHRREYYFGRFFLWFLCDKVKILKEFNHFCNFRPPPRNHETSNSSFNDSKESNEISEAECDRDNGPRGNYGGKCDPDETNLNVSKQI